MTMVRRLASDCRAAAAAEMALVAPLLLMLIVVAFEAGYFFLSEHVVQKGVRDAARYASRLSIENYPGCVPTAAAEQQIRRVAKSGAPDGDADGDGSQDRRLLGWTSDDMTTVEVTCEPLSTSPYSGIYNVYPFPDGVPVVTVSAVVPYPTLFGALGFGDATAGDCAAGQPGTWQCIKLAAASEAAVFGE